MPPGGHFINIDRFTGAQLPEGASGDNVQAEYFREGEEPVFGLGRAGRWRLWHGARTCRCSPAGESDATATMAVTTSDGQTKVVPKKANFGTPVLGWAVLSGRCPLRPSRYHAASKLRLIERADPMRAETQNHVDAIAKSLKLLGQRMDIETAPHRLEEFNALIEAPDLWNDPAKAQKLMRERQGLMDAVSTYRLIESGLNDNVELIEMGEAEGDAEIVAEAEAALKALVELAAAKELEALLDGEADSNDTFLEINAGAGGTESCDWASMLARMYVRWAEKKGYTVELQSETPGEEAGIQSVAYKISGHNAYGWLKSESGVHRSGADQPL